MSRGKKIFILVCGFLETLVFSGNILGWASLNYMLKKEGVFQHLCHPVTMDEMDNMTAEASTTHIELYEMNMYGPAELGPLDSKTTYFPSSPSDMTLLYSTPPENNASASASENVSKTLKNERTCLEQDKMLNLVYTIGSFAIGFTAFIWGFLLDRWGLRLVRLLINAQITAGTLLLSITNKNSSYLLFPAVTLMCLAGVPLRIADMQIANYFPSKGSTVITFYSGAFSASAVVFVCLKYLYDAGLSWGWTMSVLVVMSACMLPITLFLLPTDRIREQSKEEEEEENSTRKLFKKLTQVSVISPVQLEKYTVISASPATGRKPVDALPIKDVPKVEESTQPSPPSLTSPAKAQEIPLKVTLLSIPFLLHVSWYSWLITYMVMYVGSLNLWLQRITADSDVAGNFANIYGLAQVAALALAPIAGIVMDNSISRAAKETDPNLQRLKTARAGFGPMLFTTLTVVAMQICKFFDNPVAVYVSIVFNILLRSLLIAVASAYLRIRFPASHFNRSLGIMSTAGAFCVLLQFPLFVWESHGRVLLVNVFNSVCILLVMTDPLHLLITPLQRYLFKKEQEVAEKIKQQQ